MRKYGSQVVAVADDLHARIKEACRIEDISIRKFIETASSKYLDELSIKHANMSKAIDIILDMADDAEADNQPEIADALRGLARR